MLTQEEELIRDLQQLYEIKQRTRHDDAEYVNKVNQLKSKWFIESNVELFSLMYRACGCRCMDARGKAV